MVLRLYQEPDQQEGDYRYNDRDGVAELILTLVAFEAVFSFIF